MKRLAKRAFLIVVTLSIIVVPLYYLDFKKMDGDSPSILLFLAYFFALPYLFRALLVFSKLAELDPEVEKKTEDQTSEKSIYYKDYNIIERSFAVVHKQHSAGYQLHGFDDLVGDVMIGNKIVNNKSVVRNNNNARKRRKKFFRTTARQVKYGNFKKRTLS